MEAISAYAFSTLGWHLIQAVPLLVWPEGVSGLLLSSEGVLSKPEHWAINGMLVYFARSLGLALAALGLTTVCLTGAVPLGSAADAPPAADDSPLSPYASAVILVTALHHTVVAAYCWMRYSGGSGGDIDYDPSFDYYARHQYRGAQHPTGFLLGALGSVALASFGLWCLLFAGGARRRSRRTGADKHTSGWPFKNAGAAEHRWGRSSKGDKDR